MKTKPLGNTGIQVPILGLGGMRFPLANGEPGYTSSRGIDEEKTIELVRHAIDNGVNYIDTAFNYLHGESEKTLGKALADGYREKTILATKSPIWMIKSPEDFDSLLAKQMGRLGTDYIDCYLLHCVTEKDWKKRILPNNVLDAIQKAKADGRVGAIGFSYHDDIDFFKEVADAIPWDFCQIQLNYLDKEFQGGTKAAQYAASKGMGVMVMEPMRGGHLVNVPEKVADTFKAVNPDKTMPEWAFDYVWNVPEVTCVLSGMTSIEMLDENIAFANRFPEEGLPEAEVAVYGEVEKVFASFDTIPCTGCNYCTVCPEGITVPYNFQTYNQYKLSGNRARAEWEYSTAVPLNGNTADACTACGTCAEHCPQKIDIPMWLEKITKEFNL